jgi:predicted permease
MGWLRRLRATAHTANLDRDLAEETQFHLDALVDEYVSQGIARDDAERQARRRLGNLTLVREGTRDADTLRWLSDFARDARFGARLLRRNPWFAVAGILTFALGIGANAAIFSLFNAVVLQQLPVREPERLVLFSGTTGEGTQTGNPPSGAWPLFSTAAYDYLRTQPLPFDSLAAVRSGETPIAVEVPGGESALRARAHLVSGNYFSTLGVDIAQGRALTGNDDRAGAAPAVVVSDGFRRRAFHEHGAVVGRVVRINRSAFTIVGVTPPSFFGERMRRSPDVWVPLVFQPEIELRPSLLTRPEAYWLSLIGRLRPGVTTTQAEAAATVALRQFVTGPGSPLREDDQREAAGSRIQLFEGRKGISNLRETWGTPLQLLLAVVGFVLIIACANVGALLLSRAAARSGELSLRVALGAAGGRLVRQFIAESLLLAAGGAAIGLLVARWATAALLASMANGGSPVKATLDARVALLVTAITTAAAVLVALVPAFAAGRTDVAAGGKPSRHGWIGGFSVETLVVGQLALSLVLLVAATLLAKSLLNLQRERLGFDTRVVAVRVLPRLAGYTPDTVAALYRRLYERLSTLSGVERVSFARYSPFSGTSSHQSGAVEGYEPPDGKIVSLEEVPVGPSYPETLGIPLVQGRAIGVDDSRGRTKVGMVNQAFVRRYYPNVNPIGRHFGVSGSNGSSGPTDIEIVGVLADAQFHDARRPVEPIVFTAMLQNATQTAMDVEMELRRPAVSTLSAATIRSAIEEIDRTLPLGDPQTLESQVSGTLNSDVVAGQLVAVRDRRRSLYADDAAGRGHSGVSRCPRRSVDVDPHGVNPSALRGCQRTGRPRATRVSSWC